MKQTKGQKGISQILIIILILVAIAAGVYQIQKNTNFLPKAAPLKKETSLQQTIPVQTARSGQTIIRDGKDLQTTLNDVDNTDINAIDQDLSQNDADSASF